jgi:hypothetical protein
MPHRLISFIAPAFTSTLDIFTLGALALWQGLAAFISADDWNRITGPHGLVFVLIIGLIVVWTKSVRDDAARERRHRETIAAQESHFAALIKMNDDNATDLKALTVAATKAQMTATNAIISMDHNIIRLTNELADQSKISLRKSRRAARLDTQETPSESK